MGLYSGGLIIERIFGSEIWGAYFQEGLFFFGGGAYYWNFTVLAKINKILCSYHMNEFTKLNSL